VNTTDCFVTERDVLRALYGSVSGWDELEILNDSRGVWGSDPKPTWTRVSAALVSMKLSLSKIAAAPICLYHNPRPRKPYIGALNRLSQVIPKNNRLVTQSGESVESILGLAADSPD
jgi:hypothetical protein